MPNLTTPADDPLYFEPIGTIRETWHDPATYWIKGKGGTYHVDLEQGTCSCPQFTHRLKPGERCKHLTAVIHYAILGPVGCPECHRLGVKLTYLDGKGYAERPCPVCDGAGTVSVETADEWWETKRRLDALKRDADLRKLFA